ncbi:MAG: fatty acid desaturase family protein [Geminicoccaceae bacterium]
MRPSSASLDPRDYIRAAELKPFYRPCPWCVAWRLAADWLMILGSIAAFGTVPHPLVFVIAFGIIAARQHALNNWVHEASHFSIARNKFRNDLISDLFAATPHFIATADYRAKHKLHHTDLGHPENDTEIKSRFIIRGWKAWRRGLFSLLGVSAFLTMRTYGDKMPTSARGQRNGRMRFLVLVATTNAALFAWCWAWGVPFAWIYLWVLPLVTLTSLLATVRVIAEHQSLDYARDGREQFDEALDPAITRTIDAGPLAAFFLAPVRFNYHLEHHTWPGVPFTSLPALSRLLRERGFYEANPQFYGSGYAEVLWKLIKPQSALELREVAAE